MAYYERHNCFAKLCVNKKPKTDNRFLDAIVKDTIDLLNRNKPATVFEPEQIRLIQTRFPDVRITETAKGIFQLQR